MKKSTRIILICAICLLSAGMVLIGLGYLTGATFTNAIKGEMWNYTVSYSSDYDNDFHESNSYEISSKSIDSLSIDWINGNIKLIPYNGSKIILTEESDGNITSKNCLRYKIKNGVLNINYLRGKISFSFSDDNYESKDLVIKIPKSLAANMEDITIDSTSADFDISGLVVSSLEYDTTSGSLYGKNMEAKSLSIDTTSGDIDLKLRRCPNDISYDSTSGNCTLVLPVKSNFTASVDSISGDFHTDFNSTIDDDDYVVGTGNNYFSFDTVSGDIQINSLSR